MNKIFKIITILVLSIAVFSCESNDEINKVENSSIENLKKDARFIKLLDNEIALVENIKDLNKAESILSKENFTTEDANELAIALGFSSANEYATYIEKESRLLMKLENEYQLSELNPLKFEEIVLDASVYNQVLKGDPCNCYRILNNCVATVLAAATLAHLACIAGDLAVLPGLVCHAIVLVTQGLEIRNCEIAAEGCINDCN